MPQINRMGPQIGVEVTGVDVKSLDDAGFAPIYQAWLDHNVMVVRDQELTIKEFLRYSRRFGLVVPHPSKSTRHPEVPEITLLGINKFDADGQLNQAIYRRGAEGWHTDGAYDAEPFKATQLYALAIPSTGGDTLFANGYAAYAALPERLKQRLEGRLGAFTYGGRRRKQELLNEEDRDWTPVFHPIVRTHPETGRKSLYFDPGKILRIDGVDARESDDMIDELAGFMIQPDGEYRHRWRVGDIVIWDNRCSYHRAAGDYPPQEDRIHWRVSIKDHAAAARLARRCERGTPPLSSPRATASGVPASARSGEVYSHRHAIFIEEHITGYACEGAGPDDGRRSPGQAASVPWQPPETAGRADARRCDVSGAACRHRNSAWSVPDPRCPR